MNQDALNAGALRALEEADMALAHAPELSIDGPYRSSDITAALLETTIAKDTPDAKVAELRLAAGHDGMTSRTKWDIRWNAPGRAAGLPNSIFAKTTPDAPYLRETLSMLHMAENEVRFYNQLRSEVPEIAPRPYLARSYPGGRFIILLETLETRGLKPYWVADECSLEHAKAVTSALATLHAKFWETERFNTDLSWVRPRTSRFGGVWHEHSFRHARKAYLERADALQMPPELVEMLKFWDENFQPVYRYWDTLPATVLHGDSHLGNTFADNEGRAGYFDWQVILRGHGLRDVSYFLLSAISEDLRRRHERAIVDHYLQELASRGVWLNRENAWLDYCLFALDRFDAHIKTHVRGGYGHAESGRERGRIATVGSLLHNKVPDLLRKVVANGGLYPVH
jgi:hypothetical protein